MGARAKRKQRIASRQRWNQDPLDSLPFRVARRTPPSITGLPKTRGIRSNLAAGIVRPAHGRTISDLGATATMAHALPPAAPAVRLELRHGSARSVVYDVTGEEFVLGSAVGCDLRLP